MTALSLTYYDDDPLRYQDGHTPEDEYHREPYARELIRALEQFGQQSVVIGLEGTWGTGKTSILSLMHHELAKRSTTDQPIIVEFNPWWYTGRDDLASQFFVALAKGYATEQEPDSKRSAAAKLLSNIGVVAKPLGFLAGLRWGDKAGESLEQGLEAVGETGNFLALFDRKTLHDHKKEAERKLAELAAPVWVLLDDIDRLLPQEAIEVLTLIRGVGNLPYVRYILAYDRTQLGRRVASGIGGSESDGREYINKIVQLSFPVPEPLPGLLEQRFLERFNQMLNPPTPYAVSSFPELKPAFGALIRTPRDTKRLLNAFAITHGLVPHELDMENVLLLELLRLEFPRFYEALPRHKWALVATGAFVERDGPQAIDTLIDATIPDDARKVVREIVCALFPLLAGKLQGMAKTGGYLTNEQSWLTKRLVTSSALFDCYFQRGLDERVVRVEEIVEVERCLHTGDVAALTSYVEQKSQESVKEASHHRDAIVLQHAYNSISTTFKQDYAKALIETLLGYRETWLVGTTPNPAALLGQWIAVLATKYDYDGNLELLNWTLTQIRSAPVSVVGVAAGGQLLKTLHATDTTRADKERRRLIRSIRTILAEPTLRPSQALLVLATWGNLTDPIAGGVGYGVQPRVKNKALRGAISSLLKNKPTVALLMTTHAVNNMNVTLNAPDATLFGGINPRLVERFFAMPDLKRAVNRLIQARGPELAFHQAYRSKLDAL
jgi:hypothetical protein